MKMGSPMILTCMNRILQNPQKYEIKHIYRYEGNTDPEMKQSFMVSNPNQEKGVFVAGFAANSISDAAQVLFISIKTE
jgi:capsule polysaccharide modification protein KpsS